MGSTTRQAKSEDRQETVIQNGLVNALLSDMRNVESVADGTLKDVEAILDAVAVLCALERSPEHHDAHPSHDLKTGGGYAHGTRLHDDTLPRLLNHARGLVQMANDDYKGINEEVVSVLAEQGGKHV